MTDLEQATIAFARSQLGQEERPRGSNWGQPVETYLAYVGVTAPAAWCAAFVSYSVNQGAIASNTTSTLKPSAGALRLYFKNPEFSIPAPQSPCIGVIDEGKGLGHAFFVVDVDGDSCHTIEGNTDPAGSREGYVVAERHRPTGSITHFMAIR